MALTRVIVRDFSFAPLNERASVSLNTASLLVISHFCRVRALLARCLYVGDDFVPMFCYMAHQRFTSEFLKRPPSVVLRSRRSASGHPRRGPSSRKGKASKAQRGRSRTTPGVTNIPTWRLVVLQDVGSRPGQRSILPDV